MINNQPVAIILGGRIMGLAAIRSLAKRGINTILIYHDSKDFATHSKYLSEKIKLPHPENHEEDFISKILDLSEKYKGAVIYPTEDEFLITISKNKPKFSPFFKVACNDIKIIDKLINKKLIYDLADQHNIPCPIHITTSDDKTAANFADRIGYPCLLKPSQSHTYFNYFGKKMAKVENKEELLLELKKANAGGFEVMIQEFISGSDSANFSYWGYRTGGKFFSEATARKVRNDPPETGSPRVQVTKNIPELIPYARKILNELDYEGYANVEFKFDRKSGEYKFMEINPRINRCIQQAIKGGIDYPFIIYNHLVNNQLPNNSQCEEDIYWIDWAKDLIRSIQFRKKEKYSFKQLMRPYFSKHAFGVFDLKDPMPFMKRLLGFVKK
jgi:predicted ATP-grasp superfamily ATP-dependent carboligase